MKLDKSKRVNIAVTPSVLHQVWLDFIQAYGITSLSEAIKRGMELLMESKGYDWKAKLDQLAREGIENS